MSMTYDIKVETAKNRYLVVQLNIYPYTGTKQDKLLHCLDLDVISPVEMKKLVIRKKDSRRWKSTQEVLKY